MSQAELNAWAPILLAKIHVISGWTLPSGDMYTIIEDQFRKLLTEEFFEMNPDEIEYAFRTRSDTVEDWGKNMNLGLINRILKPYLKERYYISDMEAKMKFSPDSYCDESSKNWWRQKIQTSYQAFLAGDEPYLFHHMYDVLVDDNFIEKTYYKMRFKQLQERCDKPDDEVMKEAKCSCVKDLFYAAKKQKLPNIYKPF